LYFVDVGAILFNVCSIVDIISTIHQANGCDEIPGRFRMLSIGIVASISSESSTDIKEAAVRD
jgi:hypothetical protein